MVNSISWEIRPFEPAEATRSEWEAYHRHRKIRKLEIDPDDETETSDETVERQMKHPNKDAHVQRELAWQNGEIVGFLTMYALKPEASGYESNKRFVRVFGGVQRSARRQGIGGKLAERALQHVEQYDAEFMDCFSSEEDGKRFLEAIGGPAKQIERESRLYIDKLDRAQIRRWVEDLAKRAPGVELKTYPVRLPDDFLEVYCPARSEMMNLMPWDELEHGEIVIKPENWKKTYEQLDLFKSEHHTIITEEPDGKISSITDVEWKPEHPGRVNQWFTGVHPDYRGRGLGKAIKAAMLEFVMGRYEDLKFIGTENADTNASMLAINERLGFKPHMYWNAYQISKQDLQRFVEG